MGDRHEEPAAYEPPAEPGYPVEPGGYGEPAPQDYGGYPEPGQYVPPPGDHAGHEYRQEGFPQPYAEQPYPEQPYRQQPYAEQPYVEPYPQQLYAEPPSYVDSYGRPYAEQPYAQGYVEQVADPSGGAYGYPDAADAPPALVEPAYDPYDYGGGNGEGGGGATSVMPAVIDAGSEPDYAVEYEPDPAYRPAEPGAALEPVAAETAYVPAPRAPEPEREPAPGSAGPRIARTPVWDPPGFLPALGTLGLAAALAGTAQAGKPALLVGVAFLQVLTAVGWFRLNGMWPARQGIALVVLAAFATDAAVWAKGAEGLASVPAVLAVTLLAVIVMQARGGARPGDLLPALTVTASAALVAAFDVAYVVAVDLEGGPMKAGAAVVPAVLAVGAAVLIRGVPLPTLLAPFLGWSVGTAVGAGAGIALGGEAPVAALLGGGAAALGLLGHRVAGYDHPSRFVHFTAGVALPLALAAPAAYLLGRVMIG